MGLIRTAAVCAFPILNDKENKHDNVNENNLSSFPVCTHIKIINLWNGNASKIIVKMSKMREKYANFFNYG